MAKTDLRVTLLQESQQVSIEIWHEGAALAHGIMDAPELDDFIKMLGQFRAMLADGIPLRLEPNSRVESVTDPAWFVSDEPLPDGRLLALRHPGFGWIGYILPAKEADTIAGALPLPPASE